MIWFLSLLCLTLYILGVLGMGALFIAIEKSVNNEPEKDSLVKFAITWPYQVFDVVISDIVKPRK